MTEQEIVTHTIEFVKNRLEGAEAGHDWSHTERVYRNSLLIAEAQHANLFVVSLGALLHDIADSKFHEGDEEIGPELARKFLESMNIDPEVIDHVVEIIRCISYKNTLSNDHLIKKSAELEIVQDADRLDAMGAIGIARAFNYGGFKNRPIYDPGVSPNLSMTKEEYKVSSNPTINHFYEKLLLLKDQMNTEKGKKLARERHQFMLDFLDRFYSEWNTE